MTLFADDPDAHVIYPITVAGDDSIDFTPIVKVAGFADITAAWVSPVGPTRDLKVPLVSLTAGPVHRLRLVVPGDNDVILGDIVLASNNPSSSMPVTGTDHGTVTGTLAITGGNHELDISGAVTVTIAGNADATLWVHGTGTLTVAGTTFDIDGDAIILVVRSPRGVQTAHAAGAATGGTVPDPDPVEDAPTQPGTVTVTPTADGYTLSWVASTVASGYEVQIDGGTWVDSGTDTAHTFTGLASGSTHSGAVRAYNTLGTRSATRTWGPSDVVSVGLHEQLLSFEPELYVRMSQGSRQVYDFDTSGVWDQFAPGTITYDGPPLVPGATGSALFSGGNIQMYREGFGTTLRNTNTMTIVAVVKWPETATAGVMDMVRLSTETEANPFNSKATANIEGGNAGYEATSIGGVHTFAWVKSSGSSAVTMYRDGVAITALSGSEWSGSDPITRFYVRRSSNDFIISHLFVSTKALTSAEVLAIAEGAGTVGNPR